MQKKTTYFIFLMCAIFSSSAESEELYKVPDLTALNRVTAAEILTKAGVTFEITDTGPCMTDVITRHFPEAGYELNKTREVIFLQTGLLHSTIPPQNTNNLSRVLKAMDFVVQEQISPPTAMPNNNGNAAVCFYKDSRIVSTTPVQGTEICPGSSVTINLQEFWKSYDCR